MARNSYKNIERLGELLNETGIPALQKEITKAEKRLSEALKKLSEKEEVLKAKRAEAQARAEEEKRAEAEKAREAEEVKAEKSAEEVSSAPEKSPEKKESAPAIEVKKAQESAPAAEKEEKREDKPQSEKKDTASAAQKSYTYTPVTENVTYVPAKPRTGDRQRPLNDVSRHRNDVDGKTPLRRTFDPNRPQSDRPRFDKDGKPILRRTFDPNRPQGSRPAFSPDGKPRAAGRTTSSTRTGFSADVATNVLPPKDAKGFGPDKKKKTFEKTFSEKKPLNKRAMIKQEGLDVSDFDDDKSGYRKARFGKKEKKKDIPTIKIERAVVTTKEIPIKVLSEKIGVSAVEITKRLFKEGIMKSVNESIDYDNAALLAIDLGIELEYNPPKTAEELLTEAHDSPDESGRHNPEYRRLYGIFKRQANNVYRHPRPRGLYGHAREGRQGYGYRRPRRRCGRRDHAADDRGHKSRQGGKRAYNRGNEQDR